ncbi:protein PLASTID TRANSCRIPTIONALLY ACTIVE 16, chloroplastic [Physcomitrium patens]|uniref:NAD(P)-binding domain-containing protein n=1 Tax=Physcomitrium patens TaxID=3218 RepID=A0A2K1L8C3_PHYPA|nr:protein plastid transcriptionally active 16, chloroplastic-like [Physcomitrium patens]PNR62244.1 hypothetical protein PHYPA_000668 [Physcomitrium patens]|eukprot:XP_024379714.1 protein plastid transcriptionally active 16, chloroplastic-like [Physcomitrella patens]
MATTRSHGVVATASAVCVGVDAAASTSGRRVGVRSGKKQCAPTLASRRSIAPGVFRPGGRIGGFKEQRQPAVGVRAAEDNSILKKGTQFFTRRGRKDDAGNDEASPSGTQFFTGLGGWGKKPKADVDSEPARGGTQFFSGIGGWGKKQAEDQMEEDEESSEQPASFGTQRLRFGTKRGSVDNANGAGTMRGGALVKKENTALDVLPFGRGRRSDPKTVFIAGATGQIGARISQQLLRAGFNIRGGVRELYFAQQLAEFATQYGVISREEAKRMNAVEFDFKDVASILKAIGNASKVVVTVGPVEDGPRSEVSVDDALRVLEAAQIANVSHFVAVYESGAGTAADGPLAGISSFFSNLFSGGAGGAKDDAHLLDSLVETDMKYTFIRSPSTEGVDDYSPSTSNLVIAGEGASDASGKVSKIQVASVVAAALSHTTVSENKVLVVASDPYAPPIIPEEALSVIPIDERRAILQVERAEAEELAREQEARKVAEAEARAAAEEARQASQLAVQLEAEAKRLAAEEARASVLAAEAQARAEAAAASVDGLTIKVKEVGIDNFTKALSGRGMGIGSFASKVGTVKGGEKSDSKVLRNAKLEEQMISVSSIVESPSNDSPRKPASKSQRNIFGNIFKQDTFFIDDE